jgi:hypothetical protein
MRVTKGKRHGDHYLAAWWHAEDPSVLLRWARGSMQGDASRVVPARGSPQCSEWLDWLLRLSANQARHPCHSAAALCVYHPNPLFKSVLK